MTRLCKESKFDGHTKFTLMHGKLSWFLFLAFDDSLKAELFSDDNFSTMLTSFFPS